MRPHARHFNFSMGAPDPEYGNDYFIHGSVRARTPEKALKKARRIQIKTGWPLLSMEPEHQLGGHFYLRSFKKRVNKGEAERMEVSGWDGNQIVARLYPRPRHKTG